MKRIVFLIISILLTSCVPVSPTETDNRAKSVLTASPISEVSITQEPVVTETPIASEVPTKASKLHLDPMKKPDEWDLSIFSAEQQDWINQAMTDPDHAPIEVKNFYDQVRIEGIKEQTADQNITLEKYAEWLFSNGIRETAPLPFSWRKANLENPDNLVGFNHQANRGYMIEGYEGLGNLSDETKSSGFGENEYPYPDHATLMLAKDFRVAKGNQNRDTIFGEPSLIILPRDSYVRGDLMALTAIAGISPDTAQEAIIRMFDETRAPRYTIVRLQYADEIIQEGDTSCETIPGAKSIVCPPGTVVKHAIMTTWKDWQSGRHNAITPSRQKLVALFDYFQNPPMITIGDHFGEEQFMDGAIVTKDIRIPMVPDAFLN